MPEKLLNPFKYGCVVQGDYFCPRPQLEADLQSRALNGQNVVIQGERRMGKTSLVKKAIEDTKALKLLYIDLFAIRNQADFCARVLKGIESVSSELPFIKKALVFLGSLRPTLSIDPATGSPTLSVDARVANEPQSLGYVLNALEKMARELPMCIVFDEFQDVLKLQDGKKALAEMRSAIQFQTNVPYFFLGSVRNEMFRIFSSPESPFFKSALPIEVGPIDEKTFSQFLKERFAVGRRSIDTETLARIFALSAGVTGDVQQLCDALWECSAANEAITCAHMPLALEYIYSHESRGYEASIESLTDMQLTTLRTLAKTGSSEVCGKAFLEAVGCTNASAVKRAINRLIADRLVFAVKGEYRFVNPFFREWLKNF